MSETFERTPDGNVVVDGCTFPPFDLVRLLRTVFDLGERESFGIFTDLPDPRQVAGLAYLQVEREGPRHYAYHVLYRGIRERAAELGAVDTGFYAYQETGGSNLDLPDRVVTADGEELDLVDALKRHSIVLFMGRWSATAPITALAKELGLRGATMHGTNARVLATGLAVDYERVSAEAEAMRQALTRGDAAVLEWDVAGRPVRLELDLGGQEAQKSHGLVREAGDVANLPAGEVYYVPVGGAGVLPYPFDDEAGTIALFDVKERGVCGLREVVRGNERAARAFLEMVEFDPNAGQLTELGLGTQELPWAYTDIQDEKILGTAHVATGRSDHLGGKISSACFRDKRHAFHNDILFTPVKTPEAVLKRVTMRRGGEELLLIEDYAPAAFLREARARAR